MEDIIKEIYRLNERYAANDYNGVMASEYNYRIIPGEKKILLSAPHAVRTVRDNILKPSDALTGAIVEYLCSKTNCFGIIRTCNLLDDPNYYSEGYSLMYKKAIVDLIKDQEIPLLIDLHGCSDKYPFDIDIGIDRGRNIQSYDPRLSFLVSELSKAFNVTIDEKFRASYSENLCKYVYQNTGVSCYQMEISRELRMEKTLLLLKTLEDIINDLDKINQEEKDGPKRYVKTIY